MRRALWVLSGLIALGALWLLSERNRLLLRDGERTRELMRSAQRIRDLEQEVAAAFAQRTAMAAALEARAESLATSRRQQLEERAKSRQGMPEGLRLVLAKCNARFAAEGHPALRFLNARSLGDDRVLTDVEILDQDVRSMQVTVYLARELRAVLDRARARVELRLRDGAVVRNGSREPFGPEGWIVTIEGVEGAAWEEELPMLITAEGAYPAPDQPNSRPQRLDGQTLELWRDRLNSLLGLAQGPRTWRLERCEGLDGASFTGALLVGLAPGRRIEESAEVARATIVADKRKDLVELVLEEGILRQRGGETRIAASGYRVLLAGVTARQAIDAMMGMVRAE